MSKTGQRSSKREAMTVQEPRSRDIGAALKATVKYVRQMTPEQRRQSLIDAGILTKSGKLAARYR